MASVSERPVVAYMFDRPEEGDVFTDWPAHITLLPPVNRRSAEVLNAIEETVAGIKALLITIGSPDTFGSDAHPVNVFHIEPAEVLRDLHRSLLHKLGGTGIVHDAVEEWLGDHYTAHVTLKPGQKQLATGEKYNFDHLATIGKEAGQRIVRHVVDIK